MIVTVVYTTYFNPAALQALIIYVSKEQLIDWKFLLTVTSSWPQQAQQKRYLRL